MMAASLFTESTMDEGGEGLVFTTKTFDADQHFRVGDWPIAANAMRRSHGE
ncbi:hypothetical protein ACQKJZ_19120 [Sphingomonas sp. NPDC019816]|uniref:hypothetical protein n=1 Tax=Sphingomonas sp. NPDC019816 TaxID=3390679 RepID=UPI003D017A73